VLVFKSIFLLFFVSISFAALSQTEGRLISLSSSGETTVFNLGKFDEIFEGDESVILKKIAPLEDKALRIVPVAKARCIKTSSHGSIWILYQIINSELLVAGDKFLIMTDTNSLRGQVDPKLERTTIVGSDKDLSKDVKNFLNEDKDRIAKKKDEFESIGTMHAQEPKTDRDVTLVDVDEWKRSKNTRYRSAIYKSTSKNHFKRSYRLEKFYQLVTDYLNRVNDPEFSYDKFFADQMRDGTSNEFRKKTYFNTEYEDFLYRKSKKSGLEVKLYQSLLKKGSAWSEDFSDDQLRDLLGDTSVLNEEERRVHVISKPLRYAVFFDYGTILNDNQTSEDSSYQRSSLAHYGLDFEFIPFLKHETLERFTFNLNPSYTKSALKMENANVDFNNMTSSFGFNWYPTHSPYTVHFPLFFIGSYLRFGYAVVESPIFSDAAKYTSYTVPGFRSGLKLNLKNRFGLRIVGSVESLKLERYEVNRENTFLSEKLNVFEAKVMGSISYSF
jgi:hypothetical protein